MDKATNDYELIYLVQSHQDGVALEYLFKKYDKLIWKYIHLYNVPFYEQEDFHQEGKIILYQAITYFNEEKGKTLTKYFELILKRRFWRLIKELPNYNILEDYSQFGRYEEEKIIFLEEDFKSDIEKYVFNAYFLENQSVSKIENETGYQKKQIYNAIYRIKEKLKWYYINNMVD